MPLEGINLPFHSDLLRSTVAPFREWLDRCMEKGSSRARELSHRWIPNVVGRPFECSRDYFAAVAQQTQSDVLHHIVANWSCDGREPDEEWQNQACRQLVIELMVSRLRESRVNRSLIKSFVSDH